MVYLHSIVCNILLFYTDCRRLFWSMIDGGVAACLRPCVSFTDPWQPTTHHVSTMLHTGTLRCNAVQCLLGWRSIGIGSATSAGGRRWSWPWMSTLFWPTDARHRSAQKRKNGRQKAAGFFALIVHAAPITTYRKLATLKRSPTTMATLLLLATAGVVSSPTCRDRFFWPFAETSIW